MRVTVGAIAVLGLAVTVATGQPVKERAAALKAPEPLAAGDLPPVARGAIDDFPPSLSSTPVPRSNSPAARTAASSGPAWLTGADPNVVPAAGSSRTGSVLPPTPSRLAKDDLPVPPPPKMLDRIKGLPRDKAHATSAQPVGQTPPVQSQQQPQPTASTPFRGTGANGAPVFAGPPAYRWYGWGTVTPGANPLAPAGQYPKASANWYSITGATPGAFPVPVSNPDRIAPGTEPPTYGLAARQPGSAPIAAQPHGQPHLPIVERPSAERPEAPRFTPPNRSSCPARVSASLPPPMHTPPSVPSMPVSVPTLTPPPVPKSAAVAPPILPPPSVPPAPASVAVGPLSAPAAPVAPPMPPAAPKSEPASKPEPAAKSDPVAALPPMPPVPALPPASPIPSVAPSVPVSPAPVEPGKAPAPPAEAKSAPAVDAKLLPVAPAPLPTSVTADPPREEQKWQQSSEPAAPRPGTWAPATEAKPLPTVPVEPLPSWQTGAAKSAGVVARAQMPDNTPDPIAALIKQVCQGRAEGVEIRFTGTKKLQVCFEVRGANAAKQLVSDISKRPELTAYQIDFCVVVK